jgi:hypothetical protein
VSCMHAEELIGRCIWLAEVFRAGYDGGTKTVEERI